MSPNNVQTRVLHELARRYELSRIGRTGQGVRDLIVDYEELLAASGCRDGEVRAIAVQELSSAARAGVINLIAHRRDPDLIQQLRFSSAQEDILFIQLGKSGPRERRRDLASRFVAASHCVVPPLWTDGWITFCSELASAAECGGPIAPFSKEDLADNAELLELIPKLLSWRGLEIAGL